MKQASSSEVTSLPKTNIGNWCSRFTLFVMVFLILLIQLVSAPPAFAQPFVHPGGLHTLADLDRMKTHVAAGDHPWIDGWNRLIADPHAQNNYRAAPRDNMGVSRQRAQNDATAAYLNALRWYISGDTSFADCAVRNLNGWSAAVNQVPHGVDQPGLGGIPIGTFALAAEVLRLYPGWAPADQTRFKAMLLTYFYPACDDFLNHHNGGGNTRYWANWDTANILAVMAIGVYCDDRAKFDQAVEYFKNGAGNGSIANAVVALYPGNLGQWQESGRDYAHALGGMGLLAEACQVAWNQNVDLFGYGDNRLLAAAEYAAQHTQWKGVPYTYYTNSDHANQFYISSNYHGRLENDECFELLYNHYVVMKRLSAPNVKRYAELRRPEPGNADILGYGTLTFTLDAKSSPYPAAPTPPVPMDVAAVPGINRVDLSWPPSGAYATTGYTVSRATTSGGPYAQIFSTDNNTSPYYTDEAVTAGTTYYYLVSAHNQAGTSPNSAEVSATPAAGGPLPAGWLDANVGAATVPGSAQFSDVAGGSLVVTGEGTGLGGSADGCHFAYLPVTGDFTLTARLTQRTGSANKIGMMMRASLDPGAPSVSVTLGDVGGRVAQMGTRATASGNLRFIPGDQYTWIPVWFRLQRTGDTVTGFQSSDGVTWFAIGQSTVPMGTNYLAGFLATSATNSGALATASFDHVSAAVSPPAPPAAPAGLSVAWQGNNAVLSWTNAGGNQNGVQIECSTDGTLFYEIADLGPGAKKFTNTGLDPAAVYAYRIRTYNCGGFSPYSTVVRTPGN